MNKLKLLIAAVLMVWAAGLANAATDTDTFAVTATVLPVCSVAVPDLGFGNYDPLNGTDTTATTTATVTCNGTPDYTLALNVGTGTGATFAVRKMTGGANTLDYSLYTENTHTTVWGDGTGGSSTVAGTGVNGDTTHTVYGLIPSGQTVPPGLYSDTITATLSW